jgi:hypothetical protein
MTAAKHRRSHERSPDPGSRPPIELRDWHCWLILAALTAFFFRDVLLGSAWFWEDFLAYNYPARVFASVSLAMGQIPLWNPYTFNGMPFLADIQTTVFYLPCAALSLFVRNGTLNAYWLELMIVCHYVLAGVGMFSLARSYGMKRVSALVSGLVFMLSGFMIAHSIHQQVVTLTAWFPLILMFFRRVLHEKMWLWVFITGLLLGHSLLAGFPQISLYLYTFLGVVFVFEFLSTFRGKALLSGDALLMAGRAAAVVVLSLAVAGFQLLPTIELSPLSQRAEITYAKSTEGSLSWGQLLTFLYPKFFGTSTSGDYSYWGPGPYWHYWETCVYFGALPLVLALLSLPLARRNRHVFFYWGVVIVALLYALGGNFPLHSVIFHSVPGFSLFRNPGRAGILITFAAALLAGWSFDSLLFEDRDSKSGKIHRRLLLAILAGGALLWLLTATGGFVSTFAFMRNPQILALVQQTTLVGMVFLGIAGGLVFAIMRRRWNPLLALALLILFHCIDVSWFGGRQPLSNVNPAEYFARTHQLVDALKQEGKNEIFRINTRTSGGIIMDRNQGMVDRIFMMEGYTPLALQRVYAPYGSPLQTWDLLNIKYKVLADERNRISFVPHPTYLPRAFFLYRTHTASSDSTVVRYLKSPEFDHRSIAVLEKEPDVAVTPPDTAPVWHAQITSYTINSILLAVETSHRGVLVLSEIYYPGWNATIDGSETEIYRVDYNLRGIIVPAGSHAVAFHFAPESFARGSLLTFAALGLSFVGMSVSLWRRKSHSAPGGGTA